MAMIYLDLAGRGPGLIPAEQAMVPVSDRGLLYGDGLFETTLLRRGEIPLLPLHLARMAASAQALEIPFDPGRTREGALALAATLPADGAGEYALRLTLTRGPADARGYQPPPSPAPTVTITTSPHVRTGGPMSAVTASHRVNLQSPLTAHKTLSALEKVLARGEAARAGCDEAILLNQAGRVAEGAATNLFIVRKGLWLTPPLADGCLPGIMRRRVLDLSGGVEWPLTPDDLFRCDGVYLTNALLGCVPLAALDGRGLPWGSPPPFLPRLWNVR